MVLRLRMRISAADSHIRPSQVRYIVLAVLGHIDVNYCIN
jgi:hypothetical protein